MSYRICGPHGCESEESYTEEVGSRFLSDLAIYQISQHHIPEGSNPSSTENL
jgi:hypothetical protein